MADRPEILGFFTGRALQVGYGVFALGFLLMLIRLAFGGNDGNESWFPVFCGVMFVLAVAGFVAASWVAKRERSEPSDG